MPHRVLITDHPWPGLDVERGVLAGCEVVAAGAADEATLVREAADCDAIGASWAPVTAAVLGAAGANRGGLKVLARFGTGTDNFDVDAATRLRVPVTRVPDYCVGEVADHTLALLLSIWRDVPDSAAAVRAGRWEPGRGGALRRLAGRTLGIVGYGRTGRAVADRARAFGLRVLVHTRTPSWDGDTRHASLPDLLRDSDIVTLHLPLTGDTRHRIDDAAVRAMKPGAVLLNVARGGLIDPDAVLRGLEDGPLLAVGLDVWTPEPPDVPLHPLLTHPRCVVTPHTAFASRESVRELRTRASRQIADALAGRRPEHLVNPEVWPE